MGYYYSNGSGRGGFLSSLPPVTRNIIIINIILFAATWASETLFKSDVFGCLALYFPIQGSPFRIWQPLTYMFMHGNFWHIFFNMYTLWMFGGVIERMIGQRKFLLFYLLCGLGAAACNLGVMALTGDILHATVGASGAIYGLLIAFAMLFPESRLTLLFPPVSLSAKWMVVIFAGIELLTGITGTQDGVAHFAHLGGMLVGFLLILWWRWRGTLFDRKNL